MTKAFIERIKRERSIDTRSYRYIATEEHDATTQWLEIKRLPLDKLDNTTALDQWETVKRIY